MTIRCSMPVFNEQTLDQVISAALSRRHLYGLCSIRSHVRRLCFYRTTAGEYAYWRRIFGD
jgi:hypothetical protein